MVTRDVGGSRCRAPAPLTRVAGELTIRVDNFNRGALLSEPFRDASVDTLVGQAKEAISKADYAAALALLRQAVQLAPDDREAGLMLAQTEEASRRHRAAVERYQAVIEKARRVSQLLEQGELKAARDELREAEIEHGQQEAFASLDQQLTTREAAAQQARATQLAEVARSLLAAEDWRGALDAANRSLRLVPDGEVREVRDRARAEIERRAEQQHYLSAVEEAQGDVERLLEARELPRAGQRLREAIDQLGNHQAFAGLSDQIDKAKSDLRFRQRVEWAERRANEAERLIAEADRLSRAGSFDEAVGRLEAARELDPSHPDLETKTAVATAAASRQQAERQRAEALRTSLAAIASHLDALRLDTAEEAIRKAAKDFAEPSRIAPLQTRLDRLREVERSGQTLPHSASALNGEAEAAALLHQHTLATAYSWKQALLFPFRGFGLIAFWVLVGALIILDLLALIPAVGGFFTVASWLLLLVLAGLIPAVVRATLGGRNLLPDWRELGDFKRWLRDGVRFGAVLLLATWPLLVLLFTRGWHAGLESESSPLGWLAVAFLGWLAAVLVVVASGAIEAFGQRQLPLVARHVRALSTGQPETVWIAAGLFALVIFAVVLRATAVPAWLWLALPAVQMIEVYTLLLAPHLIGVLVRRHRLELSKVYS